MRAAARLGTGLLIALALGASYWASKFGIDFAVYHAITRLGLFNGGPLYGEASGLEYPMWYRYPPLFLLLFAPFAALPFKAAVVVWTLLKCVVLAVLLGALVGRLEATACFRARLEWPLFVAIVGVFVLTELRYANAQFFIFALTAAALLLAEKRPNLAAGALGLGVALKVWPLFFVPYLAVLGRWRVAAGSLVVAGGLTLAPAFYFGWGPHWQNLQDWRAQESHIAANGGSIWFPSQSLFGVLTRHLTEVDYAAMPDPNYPAVNWASWDPTAVRALWMALAAAGYVSLLAFARRTPSKNLLQLHGVAFCALVFLQPFSQKQTALVVLIWPALVAAASVRKLPPSVKWMPFAAAFITLIQPITQSGYWNRVYQVWGVDALTMLLLAATLIASIRRERG